LSAYPSVVNANKPNQAGSNIVGDELQFVHAPGDKDNTTGASIALEEALAIPAASTHKGAAAMYLSWQNETAQKVAAYNDPDQGVLPTTQAALQELSKNPDNAALVGSVLTLFPTIEPVIPGGPPTWYTKFSAEVAATIQSVALGQVSPANAVAALAEKTKQIANQAK
jgi:ABC-type glycerol-3-phosphate transport system substrate-binding protein